MRIVVPFGIRTAYIESKRILSVADRRMNNAAEVMEVIFYYLCRIIYNLSYGETKDI